MNIYELLDRHGIKHGLENDSKNIEAFLENIKEEIWDLISYNADTTLENLHQFFNKELK